MRFAVALACLSPLLSQTPQFDTESRLVLVPAIVRDAKGTPVEDLSPAEITVLDNGRPQKAVVDTFATGVAPIALVIAIQASGISAPVLANVRKMGSMIQPILTGERGCAAVMSFAETVDWLQECTSNADAITKAFKKLQRGEERKGRMLDAAQEAIHKLAAKPRMRRVLLLISETLDRGSEAELESVLVQAQAAGVTVYAATYSAIRTAFVVKPEDLDVQPKKFEQPLARQDIELYTPFGRYRVPPPEQTGGLGAALQELFRMGRTKTTAALTTGTGGTTFPFTRPKALENIFQKLAGELHTEYVLSFTPDSEQPGYHQLELRISRPGKLEIRARPGYWRPQ